MRAAARAALDVEALETERVGDCNYVTGAIRHDAAFVAIRTAVARARIADELQPALRGGGDVGGVMPAAARRAVMADDRDAVVRPVDEDLELAPVGCGDRGLSHAGRGSRGR